MVAKNDITGDSISTKYNSKAFVNNFDAIFGKKAKTPPFACKYCGAPSWVDPSDQTPPPDYCHESDHGDSSLAEV